MRARFGPATLASMSAPSFSVVTLRQRPDFAATVADRVWRAWWEPKGRALEPVADFVRGAAEGASIPSALVAHEGGAYLGSALLIASDLDARPRYTPWVAAVWVEPAHRRRGIGAALVREGAALAGRMGFAPAYLCALPHNHGFYRALGWRLVEAGVDADGLAVFRSP